MPDELGSPPKVGGVIPHFWFDVIGRFVPGAYLLVSCFAIKFQDFRNTTKVSGLLKQVPAHLFAAFVVFFISAYFAGFYIGSAAYWVTERFLLQWLRPRKLAEIPSRAIQAAEQRFGSELLKGVNSPSLPGLMNWFRSRVRQHRTIIRVSELCAHVVWAENPMLGVILSKRNGEALASRSVFFESLVLLFVARFLQGNWACAWIFVLLAFVAVLNYSHFRRRAALDPFEMLLAIAPRTEGTKRANQAPKI